MRILVLGDSWIDYLPTLDSGIYTVSSVPGASLYVLHGYLEVELLTDNYDRVIIIGGINGMDDIFTTNPLHPHTKIIYNNKFPLRYLLPDQTHPNDQGVNKIMKLIYELSQ